MFNFFKSRSSCDHSSKELVGKIYKEYLSSYRNVFDHIELHMRFRCPDCGECKDVCLGNKFFLPEMFNDDKDKKEFIKKIRSEGYLAEYELMQRVYENGKRN